MKDTEYSTEELLAREVVQNSWDAARKYVQDDPNHMFKLRFRFVELGTADSAEFRQRFGLNEVGTTLAKAQDSESGSAKDIYQPGVESLGSPKQPVRLLYIEDFGAHGLHGNPVGQGKKKSHLYKALYAVGVTSHSSDENVRGGSYGFGKSAFIRASKANMAFAYTAFEPSPNDPVLGSTSGEQVTRRLVGATWWSGFTAESSGTKLADFTGLGLFSEASSESGEGADRHRHPFTDAKADSLAEALFLETRDPSDKAQRGTSLLLVDPIADARLLVQAIEKYWWPALISPETKDQFSIEVVDFDGAQIAVDPQASLDLLPFIQSFQKLHYGFAGSKTATVFLEQTEAYGVGFSQLDEVELDSIADPELQGSNPIVALVRGPRMVISYLVLKKRRPIPVRGVFATRFNKWDIDGLLRETEPPTHNRWSSLPQTDVNLSATKLASKVSDFIKNKLSIYMDSLKIATSLETRQFDAFSEAFDGLFDGTSPLPPIEKGIQPRWRVSQPTLREAGGMLKASFTVTVELTPADIKAYKNVKIMFDVREKEDETNGDLLLCSATDEKNGTVNLSETNETNVLDFAAKAKMVFNVETHPYAPGVSVVIAPKITAEVI
jgi:hypothetical protein